MDGIVQFNDFYAICDHMPSDEKVLRAGGTVVFPTTGWSVELKKHQRSGPPPISPHTFELDLKITPPPPDATVTRVETPEKVEFRVDARSSEYYDAYFHLVGIDGDGPGQVIVEHPSAKSG